MEGPDWIHSAKFDVEARAPAIRNPNVPAMMQSLLEERFQLKVHHETRALEVFLLTTIDGGSKLHSAHRHSGPGSMRANAGSKGGEIGVSGFGMTHLANMLRSGRPIIDRTSLTGVFEIDLAWSPSAGPTTRTTTGGLDPANEPARQALFMALQDQFGLKLEPAVAPVEFLVIESAQNPFSKN